MPLQADAVINSSRPAIISSTHKLRALWTPHHKKIGHVHLCPIMNYQPLQYSRAEIRLLKILPCNTTENRTDRAALPRSLTSHLVSCEIQHYSLEASVDLERKVPLDWSDTSKQSSSTIRHTNRYEWGDFVALSYTWGHATPTAMILVDGSVVPVRTNLEAALRRLRNKKPIASGTLVWVDALCIDQDNLTERETEVKRIRTIYKSAYDVVVWLGSEDQDSSIAIGMLKIMAASVTDGREEILENTIRQHPHMFGTGSWKALGLFLNRPYWNRAWIMQEIAMGTEKTPVLCGDDIITWDQIYRGVYKFGTRIDDLMFLHIEAECRNAGIEYRGLNRHKIIHLWEEQLVQSGAASSHYMSILDIPRKSYATDSRDKVYGILGLIPSEVARLTNIDYNKDPHEVFASFTGTWIMTSK